MRDKMAPSLAMAKTNPFPGAMPIAIKKTVNFLLPELSTPCVPIQPLNALPGAKESPLHIGAEEDHALDPSQPPLDAAAKLHRAEAWQANQATKKTKGDLNAVKQVEWKAKWVTYVLYDAKCKKLKRQGVPKLQWPHAPWYPLGKKSYEEWSEEWSVEGDEPEYDEMSFDEGPSWEASNSEEGSTEELESIGEHQ